MNAVTLVRTMLLVVAIALPGTICGQYILKSEGGFDAAMHGVYELFGLGKRYRRPPYYALNDKQMEDLAEFLRQAKILTTT